MIDSEMYIPSSLAQNSDADLLAKRLILRDEARSAPGQVVGLTIYHRGW